MPTPAFILHVRSRNVAGELWLNGAPILPLHKHVAQYAYPTVSHWIINGNNTLTVHISDADEEPMVHVSLCNAHVDQDPAEARNDQLMAINWPPPEGDASSIPPKLEVSGPVQHGWGEWYWQRAPAFGDNQATIRALVAYVHGLHASLAAGSIDTVIAHSSILYDEYLPLYDKQPADGPAHVRQLWTHVSSRPGFELAPFDPDDLDLRLRCGWQLIQPLTRRGENLLRQRTERGEPKWTLPIFIARTHFSALDQLAIVR